MIDLGRNSIPSIFEYYTFNSYFLAIINHFKDARLGPKSYTQWSQKLGYKSPRSFGMIVSGQRLPSEEMIFALSEYLKLDTNKRSYLDLLVSIERRKKRNKDIDDLFLKLKKLNPKVSSFDLIEEGDFNHISKWYYLVIRQILKYEYHESETKRIHELLAGAISEQEVVKVIDKLLKLGLLTKDSCGMIKSTKQSLNTKSDIPSQAIVEHHHGMLEQAKVHLNDDVLTREFQSLTFRCQKRKMEEAKEFIRQFKEEFNKKFSSDLGDEVFQLNIQFFQHTSMTDNQDETIN